MGQVGRTNWVRRLTPWDAFPYVRGGAKLLHIGMIRGQSLSQEKMLVYHGAGEKAARRFFTKPYVWGVGARGVARCVVAVYAYKTDRTKVRVRQE